VSDRPHLTTTEAGALLGEPAWKVRRAIDALGLPVPRAGLYRLLPRELLESVRQYIDKRKKVVSS
jgi:hypothetical protein